jgi:hypothetical protein
VKKLFHRKGAAPIVQSENGSGYSLDFDHGAMPDMTGRALRHLAERISQLESKMSLPTPASGEEETWFYAI